MTLLTSSTWNKTALTIRSHLSWLLGCGLCITIDEKYGPQRMQHLDVVTYEDIWLPFWKSPAWSHLSPWTRWQAHHYWHIDCPKKANKHRWPQREKLKYKYKGSSGESAFPNCKVHFYALHRVIKTNASKSALVYFTLQLTAFKSASRSLITKSFVKSIYPLVNSTRPLRRCVSVKVHCKSWLDHKNERMSVKVNEVG